ncbi:MAG: hypothetical protein WBE92_12070 [Steroidobacteraceae bacterium]
MNASLDIRAAIMCDEVRREDNGKGLYIGVYAGDVVVKEFPAILRLTCVLLGQPKRSTEREIELKLTYDENTTDPKSLSAKADLDATPPDNVEEVQLILPNAVLTFREPTTITLSVKDGEQWRPIMKKKVLLAPSSGTSAPSQLS